MAAKKTLTFTADNWSTELSLGDLRDFVSDTDNLAIVQHLRSPKVKVKLAEPTNSRGGPVRKEAEIKSISVSWR